MSNNNKTIKIASVSGVLFTCSYKSSNLFLGSLSWDTWGSIASHLPLLISAIKVSTLSTVFKETWHSLCNVWNVWCKEFSLQNWSTILITLKGKQQQNYNTASTSRVAKTLITSHTPKSGFLHPHYVCLRIQTDWLVSTWVWGHTNCNTLIHITNSLLLRIILSNSFDKFFLIIKKSKI